MRRGGESKNMKDTSSENRWTTQRRDEGGKRESKISCAQLKGS